MINKLSLTALFLALLTVMTHAVFPTVANNRIDVAGNAVCTNVYT